MEVLFWEKQSKGNFQTNFLFYLYLFTFASTARYSTHGTSSKEHCPGIRRPGFSGPDIPMSLN